MTKLYFLSIILFLNVLTIKPVMVSEPTEEVIQRDIHLVNNTNYNLELDIITSERSKINNYYSKSIDKIIINRGESKIIKYCSYLVKSAKKIKLIVKAYRGLLNNSYLLQASAILKNVVKGYDKIFTIDKKDISKNVYINISGDIINGFTCKENFMDQDNELEKKLHFFLTSEQQEYNLLFNSLYNVLKDGENSILNQDLKNKRMALFLSDKNGMLDFFYKIFSGINFYKQIRENILSINSLLGDDLDEAKINLIWFFYGLAILKNQFFNEGLFVIDDPGFLVYNFLAENNTVSQVFDIESNSFNIIPPALKNKVANCKHFQNYYQYIYSKQCNSLKKQAVLDMIKSRKYFFGTDIPTGNPNILFGKLTYQNQDKNKNKIFIKPINYSSEKGIEIGLNMAKSVRDTAFFGINFITSFIYNPQDRNLEDNLEPLKPCETYYRKEYVPEDLLIRYKKLYENITRKNIDTESVNSLGISFILDSLIDLCNGSLDGLAEDLEKIEKPDQNQQIQFLLSKIKQKKELLSEISPCQDKKLNKDQRSIEALILEISREYDNLEFRFGNELILTQPEIIKFICGN